MALLKPQFMREHPVQSGMIWAAALVALFLLVMWVTGLLPLSVPFIGLMIVLGIPASLGWGYSMKSYHDREAYR
jgi:predicted RND superfamily exporter protein